MNEEPTMETMTKEMISPNGKMHQSSTDLRELKIRSVMSRDVVTATVDETVSSVAKKMADNHISCVVVAEGKRIKGIFTERDLVRGIARDGTDDGGATMSERMSSPVETIAIQVPVLEAAEMMERKSIKRLPVVAGDEMVGIVTQTDITRGLVLLSPLSRISDVMSYDLGTVAADQTVAEAAQIMAERDISCVIAIRESIPVGMLTEKDLAKYVIAAERTPSETKVGEVMSFPVHSVPITYSIISANQKMLTLRLRRLVVMDGDSIRGVLSQTDVMRVVRAGLERVDADRAAALSAITDQVHHVRGEVAELGEFLRSCFSHADGHDPMDATAGQDVVVAEIAPRIQHIMDELAQL